MFDAETTTGLANDVATAPGDLPLREVQRRIASQRDQFRHDNTIAPLAPVPGVPVAIHATAGEALPLAHAKVYYTTDGSRPDVTSDAVTMEVSKVDWYLQVGFVTRWSATLPPQREGTIVRYRVGGWLQSAPDSAIPDIWAQDGQGFHFRQEGDERITTFAYSVEPEDRSLPAWVREAVIYQIFLDRFHAGTADGAWQHHAAPNALHGGTIRGVQRALPYLQDLGVTCIWLSPITASPSYHRYDTTDFFRVDPSLGTNDDLLALTTEAHHRGIRVILDFVPAHVSSAHPAFVAALENRDGDTAGWFTFEEWPHRYRNFLDVVPSLPSLNTENEAVRAHLIGSAVHWLRDYGVDGFRIDHAIGPSMDFFVELRHAMREVAPDAFTVGEATDTPDSLRRFRNKLDAILDFPLAGLLRLSFGRGTWDLRRLDSVLTAYERFMAEGPGHVSFLDNHDMNRFLWEAGDDIARLKLAALCQFTLGATPTIYYGTEIGMTQEQGIEAFGGDVFARADMPWDRSRWNHDLLEFYRHLIRLRREHGVLQGGSRRTVHVDASTWAYLRSDAGDEALTAFNVGNDERTLQLPSGSWQILLTTGQDVSIDGSALTVPAVTGAVLRRSTGLSARL